MSKLIRLREDIPETSGSSAGVIDGNVARHLHMVGTRSKKGRRYAVPALKESQALYEGCLCNVDHSQPNQPDVPYEKRFGIWRNVSVDESGIWGDLCFNPDHALAPSFRWWVQNCQEACGFSHDALGEGNPDADGIVTITKVHRVYSVDLVANPATTSGLRESNDMADTPADPPEDGDYTQHCGKMVQAIMQDDTLDRVAKKKKILAALKLLDAGEDEDAEESDTKTCSGYEGDSGTMESLTRSKDPLAKRALNLLETLKKQHDDGKKRLEDFERKETAAERERKARKLCESSGFKAEQVTPDFLAVLVESDDETRMKRLVEDRRKLLAGASVKRPISTTSGNNKIDVDAFVAGFRGN